MVTLDSSGFDDLIRELERANLGNGQLAEAMVEAAADEIRGAWREAVQSHGLIDTGDMLESIGFPGPIKKIGDVLYQDVYPQGKDRKGVRNAEKAFINHYGRKNLKPTYFVDDANSRAEPRVAERLNKMWDDYQRDGTIPQNQVASASEGEGIRVKNKKK